MKKKLLVLILILISLFFCSCSKKLEDDKKTLDLFLTNDYVIRNYRDSYSLVCKDYDIKIHTLEYEKYDMTIVSKGKEADLFEVLGDSNYRNYAEKGLMLDLTGYIENSEIINTDDYLEKVIDALTIDGHIYALPKSIALSSLLAPEDVLQGKTSWTVWEYLDFLEKYPDARSGRGMKPAEVKGVIVYDATSHSEREFIDEEENKAYFNGESFKELLARINALEITTISDSLEDRLKNGETVVMYGDINSPGDLTNIECKTGRELYPMGYPSATDDISRSTMGCCLQMLAISAMSDAPDEAWRFIEYFLKDSQSNTISPKIDAFERRIENDMSKETFLLANGVVMTASTEKQVEKIRNAYSEAEVAGKEHTVGMIIKEETIPYFEGQKSLDEVCNVIQSRIQNMLDEGNMRF